jgi:hypothetical protein
MEAVMKMKSITTFMIISLLLVACGYPMPTMVPTMAENPTVPPTQNSAPISYPSPADKTAVPTNSPYPEPSNQTPGTPVTPPSDYGPQPGDDRLKRDQVYLDMANSQLVVIATDPIQARAILIGNMSDPCHVLRAIVSPPDITNTINIDVYTLVDTSTGCNTVIKPFTASIPLGSYASGQYIVTVNDEQLGQFVTNFSPLPSDGNLTRGEVNLDMSLTKLATTADDQGMPAVNLQGSLSDPCHQLRIALTPTTAQDKINLEVYSVYDSHTACITVIQPFHVIYPISSVSGQSSVYVNGQIVAK